MNAFLENSVNFAVLIVIIINHINLYDTIINNY